MTWQRHANEHVIPHRHGTHGHAMCVYLCFILMSMGLGPQKLVPEIGPQKVAPVNPSQVLDGDKWIMFYNWPAEQSLNRWRKWACWVTFFLVFVSEKFTSLTKQNEVLHKECE